MDAVKEIKEEKVMGEEVKKRGRPRKAKEEKKKAEKVEAELVGGKGKNGNLIPLTQRSEEEQREIRAAGGRAAAEAVKRKKALREFTRDFLMQDAVGPLKQNLKLMGVEDEDMTNLAALIIRQFSKAVNQGDLNAARTVIEWAGMAPLQQERENEAIAKMAQVMQLADGSQSDKEDEEDVIFYIPDNGRAVFKKDDLVTIQEEA